MTNADGSPQDQPTAPADRPRYGEYLPAGSAPQQTPPPYPAQPGYEAGAHGRAPSGYYDGGQYYQAGPPPVRARRIGDLVATCILLAFGFFGMLAGILTSGSLAGALESASEQRGVTFEPTSALPIVATVIWVSHLILYLAAVGISIPLLVKRRIAFWVPLVAGVIAALVFWGGIFSLILSDSALMNAIQSNQ